MREREREEGRVMVKREGSDFMACVMLNVWDEFELGISFSSSVLLFFILKIVAFCVSHTTQFNSQPC